MMPSILELFRAGCGPSSSHTMGPVRAAEIFLSRHPGQAPVRVTLFGALAATGRGHLTDAAIRATLGARLAEIRWEPDTLLPRHPNALRFECPGADGRPATVWTVYSIGGGALAADDLDEQAGTIYDLRTMAELLAWCQAGGAPIWRLAEQREGPALWDELDCRWRTMKLAMNRGLAAEGVLPGGLRLERRARSFHRKALQAGESPLARGARLGAYALAAAEENAAGGEIVTAPTCGSCGVLPAVLRYVQEQLALENIEVLRALATAGLIGNLVKANGSISGAEVGCQGEIGTACAMAAGAAAWLFGGTPQQVEYAAEMGIEHHLGLTCDPVLGLVQIPCIERNAFAAMRALDCAAYALLSDGRHRISFDEAVQAMRETGRDLGFAYRETSRGGLAVAARKSLPDPDAQPDG
jgi:L-serine dehydratase